MNKIRHLPAFILLLIVMPNAVLAQLPDSSKFRFNMELLQDHAGYRDNFVPEFRNGKFYYFNKLTGKQVFKTGYDTAYPFVGKSALVCLDGKFGVIDRKGIFLVKPVYESVKSTSYNPEIVILEEEGREKELIFNLFSADPNASYIVCAEPAGPNFWTFGASGKFGIKDRTGKILVQPIYDSIPSINTVLSAFVAKKQGKFGLVRYDGFQLLPFEFDDFTGNSWSQSTHTRVIGMKRNNLWEYYWIFNNPDDVVKSEHKCIRMTGLSFKETIGIYESGKKFNILFQNGKTLPKDYDYISENGFITINDGKVYIIDETGKEWLYSE